MQVPRTMRYFALALALVALCLGAEPEYESDEFFKALKRVIETEEGKEKATATEMTVRVTVTKGKTKKSWFMDFAGKAELLENVDHDKNADCIVESEEHILLDVLAGNSQLIDAVMEDRIKVEGDLLKAMNIGSVLELTANTQELNKLKRKYRNEL